ncbi:MAG: PaaI family thioesterase [candidate division Zixibacteria bacterium]|nr:PaaI family thioesterase [candidate division Zixibacteria bacterium]
MKLIQRYSHCFVCGDKNDIGLKVNFFEEEGKAKAEFVPTGKLEGYKDILHGGILAALLDEVMIKSIIAKGILTVTSQMEIEFKKPAKTGERLFLEGEIKEDTGKIILTEGKALTQDGNLIAQAKGKYFRVKDEMKELLNRSLDE